MNKTRLLLLMLILISLACSEPGYKSQIRRIVKKQCNCFEKAGIILSPALIKVLEQGLNSPRGSDISLYHDLSEQEKQELHLLFTGIYDNSNSNLKDCLHNSAEIMSTQNTAAQESYTDEVASSKIGCQMERYYESDAIYIVEMTAMSEEIFDQQCHCLDSAGIVLSENVRKVLEQAATVPTPGTNLSLYDDLSKPEQEELKKFVTSYYEENSSISNCFERGRELQTSVQKFQSTTSKNMLLEISKNRKDCRLPYYVQSNAVYNVATSVLKGYE